MQKYVIALYIRLSIEDYRKMESPLLLCPTTIRPSQRPSSRLRTMPSPDGLRFAI